MIKTWVIYGTRPEAVKLRPLVQLLKADAAFETRVVCSGQHKELLNGAGLTWDTLLGDVCHGNPESDAYWISSEVQDILSKETRPDVVIVQGDTATAYGAAMGAFYAGVPVAHVEAGVRSGDLRNPFPEEFFRTVIDRIAVSRFYPTQRTAYNDGFIFTGDVHHAGYAVTGNTGIDALYEEQRPMLLRDRSLNVLVTLHRRESHGNPLRQIVGGVLASALEYPDRAFVWPLHPNPALQSAIPDRLPPNFITCGPMSPKVFVRSLANSSAVITDSGGVQEEAAALGVPCVVAREVTDRPESVEAGLAYLAGRTPEGIQQGVAWALSRGGDENPPNVFGDGRASPRIVQALKERYGAPLVSRSAFGTSWERREP